MASVEHVNLKDKRQLASVVRRQEVEPRAW